MATSSFSKAVLRGLDKAGFSGSAISKMTRLSQTQLKCVRAGDLRLKDQHLARIERATNRLVGEFAAMDLEPEGGPYTELMAEFADIWNRPLSARSAAQLPSRPRRRA